MPLRLFVRRRVPQIVLERPEQNQSSGLDRLVEMIRKLILGPAPVPVPVPAKPNRPRR